MTRRIDGFVTGTVDLNNKGTKVFFTSVHGRSFEINVWIEATPLPDVFNGGIIAGSFLRLEKVESKGEYKASMKYNSKSFFIAGAAGFHPSSIRYREEFFT